RPRREGGDREATGVPGRWREAPMMPRPTRLALAAALVALSCRAGSSAPSISPDPAEAGPSAEASADPGSAARRDAAPDPDDADADAGPADDAVPTEPAAYLAYVAEAERRCKPTPPQESTWGMVRDTEAYLGCHAKMFEAALAKLAPEKRAAL